MIADIENAIVTRIKTAHATNVLGYKLKKIDTYGGDLDDQINQVVHALPAIWVIFIGARKKRTFDQGARVEWEARFSVIAAAKSLRNEASARHGSQGRVGSYQMTKDINALLSGETFGLDIDPLDPQRIFSMLNNRSDKDLASIYASEFKTSYIEDYGEDTASLDNFTTFHSDWDVPVFGNVDTNIPSESTADASNTITLETTP